jgi:hypothetical protein
MDTVFACLLPLALSISLTALAADLKLVEAVQKRDQKTVLALLGKSSDVNAPREERRRDCRRASQVADHGADLNAKDNFGRSVLK